MDRFLIEKLLKKISENHFADGFLIPDYQKNSILCIPGTLIKLMDGDPKNLPILPEEYTQSIPKNSLLLHLIVDSLGFYQLLKCHEKGFLGDILDNANLFPITSIFPTTTTSALTTMHTGSCPSTHGILGCRVWEPDYGFILNAISMSPIGEPHRDWIFDNSSLNIEKFLQCESAFSLFQEQNLGSTLLVKDQFQGHALSRLLFREHKTTRFMGLTDMCTLSARIMNKASCENKPYLVNSYWPMPDSYAHCYGIDSVEYHMELRVILQQLKDCFLSLLNPKALGRTFMIITADHGQVPMSNVIQCEDHPDLMNCLMIPPTGEYRASFLFTRNGYHKKAIDYVNDNFYPALCAYPTTELIQKGIFGKKEGPGLKRAGDITVLAQADHCLSYAYPQNKYSSASISHHGSLTKEELVVPFLVLRGADLI